MLDDSVPSVRTRAVIVLGDIGKEMDYETLKKILSDPSPDVRGMAIGFLPSICKDKQFIINEINKALNDEDKEVRFKAKVATRFGEAGFEEDSNEIQVFNNKNELKDIKTQLLKILNNEEELKDRENQVLIMMIFNEFVDQFLSEENDSIRRVFIESLGRIIIGKKISDYHKSILNIDDYLEENKYAILSDLKFSKNYTIDDSVRIIFRALNDDSYLVRHAATNILIEIASLENFKVSSIESLRVLQKALLYQVIDYDLFSYAIGMIQWKLGFYSPFFIKNMTRQVYISYNWQEDSNKIANQIVQAFEARGIEVIRDKTHTGYKDSIKEFMKEIGKGKCVIAVISDRYLKSPNCMFELVEIAKAGNFYKRIFPIVLKDAKIYKPDERLKYIHYWEKQIEELETTMKSGGLSNLQGITEDLNSYTEIRTYIASLTNTLKDMNTLTIDLHCESEFKEMIQAVEAKFIEDSQDSLTS